MTSLHPPPRVLVITHEAHAGLGRLGDLDGAVVDERRPDVGDQLPADLSGHDGLVVLGGSMACWEDAAAPWLPHTRALLASAVRLRVPTLGICLGAQLLAVATGGAVERGNAGLEVGLTPVELTEHAADDPFFAVVAAAVTSPFPAVQWHQDAVTTLPPGTVLLGTGRRYRYQAFRVGDVGWGVQYHPEVSAEDWADWMDGYHDALHPQRLGADQVDAEVVAAEAQLAALAEAHAEAFAGVLRARRGAAVG